MSRIPPPFKPKKPTKRMFHALLCEGFRSLGLRPVIPGTYYLQDPKLDGGYPRLCFATKPLQPDPAKRDPGLRYIFASEYRLKPSDLWLSYRNLEFYCDNDESQAFRHLFTTSPVGHTNIPDDALFCQNRYSWCRDVLPFRRVYGYRSITPGRMFHAWVLRRATKAHSFVMAQPKIETLRGLVTHKDMRIITGHLLDGGQYVYPSRGFAMFTDLFSNPEERLYNEKPALVR